jgi:hypothetical protein
MKLVLIMIPLFLISIMGSPDHKSVIHTKADIGQAVVKRIPQDTSQATNLKGAVKEWISTLAEETGFEEWKTAKWESLPVGPGTHSWLIVIRKERMEIGYMLIGAMEDGKHYKLLEYGLGKQPLFSLNTLYQSMMQLALIDSTLTFAAFMQDGSWTKERYYINTLENFWRISRGAEVYYLDAKSGELLLNSVNPFQGTQPSAEPKVTKPSASAELMNEPSAQIKESLVSPSYDPFDKLSWVNGKPLAIQSILDLKLALKNHPEMTFMTKLYQPKIIYPFALLGYQLWSNDQAYIALDDDGARYIPLSSLLGAGSFYP